MPTPLSILEDATEFHARHIGPDAVDESLMCAAVGVASRTALIDAVVPAAIRRSQGMKLPAPITEAGALAELKAIAGKNKVYKSFIGQGYYGVHTPGVILRNILENPAWYTAYTPYQAEISQGRMEAILNFQTLVTDLTGMDIANGSMLDEATSAAEAVTLAKRSVKSKSNTLIVAGDVHPQTIEVIQTRCKPLGLEVLVGMAPTLMAEHDYFAVVCQYPSTTGLIHDLKAFAEQAHAKSAAFIVCTDLLALTLLTSPGEFGADIVVGNSQRFGMPMGAGGPHAAFLACKDEFKRSMPGRLVGVSKDAQGHTAMRLALQTREQHIRREKATSNICTAQVLPAVVASMYAVYHGPQGLKRIAERVASYTAILHAGLTRMGVKVVTPHVFDTLLVECDVASVMAKAVAAQANLRKLSDQHVGIALDETTSRADIEAIWGWFAPAGVTVPTVAEFAAGVDSLIPAQLRRTSTFLTHPVFNTHHSETEMLRYIRSLSDKDLALDRSMIPLGSCTMKLNATAEMIPITWPEFANLHPFAPQDQLAGYTELDTLLQQWLTECTGYAGISLQPNAGSQGEYAGLLAIKAWHESRGDHQRTVCLIPESAHGTNPASAQMCGMSVVVTKCDKEGNIDLADLKAKCEQHADKLAAIMITYPSTYGVFDTHVKEICQVVKAHGGRVYVDGANMNALVGVAAPGEFGGDVSHLNLHKTFCIPHGGGGPGVGPVCVVDDLVPFLPAHRTAGLGKATNIGAVSAAPLGNAAVLPISWMYIRMMGAEGLKKATEVAILSANYVAARLSDHYDIHFSGGIDGVKGGGVAHECILDLRPLKDSSGVSAEDVAKRLIDYGFHAPTLSFPVAGTLMVEPTESESRAELDRFIDAMIQIRHEIAEVEAGKLSREDNPLVNAPHTAMVVSASDWAHGYSREVAAYPLPSLRRQKYWSPVGRVDNVYGDRNLFCSCVPLSEYDAA
ncbi:aminomethyl-transferring glycine dehydrogenase [Pelomonas sp. UHG3]|uniref:Aminomethyl-transferring glycine dehydrogenase n=1 Tax=Roseateles hydrophilus TaxID=2975054 RepID=A0ACC6C774_9BURK|nr:aminomethyl-transferring glycine dehydrogenase [Pelomonas sp. UHG3]MCY4744268.1 aminomethyl-transferring glycine dehydrogenase [Pelomonas sp. UHG3]